MWRYPAPPPRKGNTALIIGLVAGAVVLLLGGVAFVALVYVVGSVETLPTPTSVSREPMAEPPPSSDPAATGSPTTEPPTELTTGFTPTPGQSLSQSPAESNPPTAGAALSHEEFEDWNFRLGDVAFQAEKAGGWDYDSCDPVDGRGGVLAGNNCEQAIQVVYSAYGGNLKAVQILLAFPSSQDAKAAVTALSKAPSTRVKWRRDQTHASYAYGRIRVGDTGPYAVVTIVTATKPAGVKAAKFHRYLQSDAQAALLFRS